MYPYEQHSQYYQHHSQLMSPQVMLPPLSGGLSTMLPSQPIGHFNNYNAPVPELGERSSFLPYTSVENTHKKSVMLPSPICRTPEYVMNRHQINKPLHSLPPISSLLAFPTTTSFGSDETHNKLFTLTPSTSENSLIASQQLNSVASQSSPSDRASTNSSSSSNIKLTYFPAPVPSSRELFNRSVSPDLAIETKTKTEETTTVATASVNQSRPTSPSSSEDLDKKHTRKYQCKTCVKSFTTSGHLARHVRIHTGERKHQCPFPGCESRFARQDNCMQHFRTHQNKAKKRSKRALTTGLIHDRSVAIN